MKQGWTSSVTMYTLHTTSSLPNYEPGYTYVVQRRFNDFKDLNDYLHEVKEYLGQNIS